MNFLQPRIFSFFSMLFLFMSTANAVDFYAGAGVGSANIADYCDHSAPESCDDDGLGMRAFGGMQFGHVYALELSLDTGSGWVNPQARDAGLDGRTQMLAFGLNNLFFVPVSERVSLYAGIGAHLTLLSTDISAKTITKTSTKTTGKSGTQSQSTQTSAQMRDWDDDDWDWGSNSGDGGQYESDIGFSWSGVIGADVRLKPWLHLRGQYQQVFDVDGQAAINGKHNIDLVTASAVFVF